MLKAQIFVAWLAICCGQVLLWRRRDNLFGYLQAGFFFSAIAIPLLGTTTIDNARPEVATRYADLMTVGAITYLVGLSVGGRIGRQMRMPRFSFARVLTDVPTALGANVRRIAVGGIVLFLGSLALIGYVPILAADRVSAKYGVGIYAPGFARGSLFYNVALLVCSTVLPVMLAIVMRHRRAIDIAIAFALFAGLLASLSRALAFTGPLVFLIAVAIQRRWRAWAIVAAICFAYVGSAAFNSLAQLTPLAEGQSFPNQVAASAPDVIDHVAFLDGFEREGSHHVGLKPILASVSLDKGEFNPATYALEIRTGLRDTTGLASGGLRLPGPVWGYASYGMAGAAIWAAISGCFIGLGTVLMRRALTPALGQPGQVLNLVLAWLFYEGTFGVLGDFFFIPRVAVIGFCIAIVLGLHWAPSARHAHIGRVPTASGRRVTALPARR